jgi:hypothetical protein
MGDTEEKATRGKRAFEAREAEALGCAVTEPYPDSGGCGAGAVTLESDRAHDKSLTTQAPKSWRSMMWTIPVRTVALYQLAVGMYWFVQEIGFWGTIARKDLAVIMSASIALGIGLWLRSFSCLVLSVLLYPAAIAYLASQGGVDWSPMLLVFFGLPVLLLVIGWSLRKRS